MYYVTLHQFAFLIACHLLHVEHFAQVVCINLVVADDDEYLVTLVVLGDDRLNGLLVVETLELLFKHIIIRWHLHAQVFEVNTQHVGKLRQLYLVP